MFRRMIVVLVLLCLPIASGCSGNEPAPIPGGSVTIEASTESAAAPTPDSPAGSAPSGVAPDAPSPVRPGPDQCVSIGEAQDGRYQVYDAGSAVVRHTGNRLRIGSVEPAAGWTDRIDSEERDEVKIDFRKGPTELSLEIELDDGQFRGEICHDEDD